LLLQVVVPRRSAKLDRLVAGVENWTVTRTEQPYDVYFATEKAQVVYLSADAEHEIEDLDADKIYVIGGLVDHNK
jgi:tRNA (guanine9-N1)-methyltransferase